MTEYGERFVSVAEVEALLTGGYAAARIVLRERIQLLESRAQLSAVAYDELVVLSARYRRYKMTSFRESALYKEVQQYLGVDLGPLRDETAVTLTMTGKLYEAMQLPPHAVVKITNFIHDEYEVTLNLEADVPTPAERITLHVNVEAEPDR